MLDILGWIVLGASAVGVIWLFIKLLSTALTAFTSNDD